MNRCPPRRSTFSDSTDDEDDEFLSPKAKHGRFERIVQSLADEVATVKETISDVMSLTSDTVMPLGLKRVVKDTFKYQNMSCPATSYSHQVL